MKLRFARSSSVVLFVVLGAAAVMAAQPIMSRWKTGDVTVDGMIADWPELTSFPEGISVAASNDDRNLYLAIAASDPQRRRQLLGGGLIVWVDPGGGHKQTYGIRVPGAGFERAEGRRPLPPEEGAESAAPREPRQPDITYIEVLGPGKDDRRRLELSAETGIEAAAHVENGTLGLEVKIPLAAAPSTYAHALNASPGAVVGLGLQTPKPERTETEGGSHAGRPGMGGGHGRGGMGGMGGGGRGGGGHRGGGAGEGGAAPAKEMKLWTTVALAQRSHSN